MAFGNQAFTAEEIAHIQAALDQQLSVHDVSWRPGPGGRTWCFVDNLPFTPPCTLWRSFHAFLVYFLSLTISINLTSLSLYLSFIFG